LQRHSCIQRAHSSDLIECTVAGVVEVQAAAPAAAPPTAVGGAAVAGEYTRNEGVDYIPSSVTGGAAKLVTVTVRFLQLLPSHALSYGAVT
jgi:hypothetical protein